MAFSVSYRPTIFEIHQIYRQKKGSCLQVAQFFLNRSRQVDKNLNGVSHYTEDLLQLKAKELDKMLENSNQDFDELVEKYPLFGVPYFVKAIIMVENQEINAGSKILDKFVSPYSSTVYEKIDAAGAMLIGVSNMDEFATGASGETCYKGPARNPFDIQRSPGGSSSGPAVVVASGQCVFSLGTDTGGSIRQPAAFTNTVGIKPTYGLVSRYGVMPMASSFDQVGPFTNTVEDCLIVTEILAGKDPMDQTSLNSEELKSKLVQVKNKLKNSRKSSKINKTINPFKIGIPKEFFGEGIALEIAEKIECLKKQLLKIGHQLIPVSLPLAEQALSVYYTTMPVELSSNLERYDGIRFSNHFLNQDNAELYFTQRSEFGEEVTRRILLGSFASSSGYYDAYYNLAQKVRAIAKEDFNRTFKEVDLLLTPVTPEFPFKLGEKTSDPLSMYLSDIFTCGINPVRIPGISVPLGLLETVISGEKVKLPTGVQVLADELGEDKIFQLALEIEKLVETQSL